MPELSRNTVEESILVLKKRGPIAPNDDRGQLAMLGPINFSPARQTASQKISDGLHRTQ